MATVSRSAVKVAGSVAKPGGAMPGHGSQGLLQKDFMKVVSAIATANEATPTVHKHWKTATAATRFTNFMGPLLLGVIAHPGSNSDIAQRRVELDFLIDSTRAAAAALTEPLKAIGQTTANQQEELESILAHTIGPIWEKSGERSHDAVKDFIATVVSAVSDPEFAQRHGAFANKMVEENIGLYQPADKPETIVNRVATAMQTATVRLHEAAIDKRLENPVSGALFLWGRSKTEVAKALAERFDQAMRNIVAVRPFDPVFSNNQRAGMLQVFVRHASNVMAAEYVAKARSERDWIRTMKDVDPVEWKRRIAVVDQRFPEVVEELGVLTEQTLESLIPDWRADEGEDEVEGLAPKV